MIDVKNLDVDIRSTLDGFTLPQNQSIRLAFTVLAKHLNVELGKNQTAATNAPVEQMRRRNEIRDRMREVAIKRGILQRGDMMFENYITDVANELARGAL